MIVWLLNPYGPLPGEAWRDYRFTLIARHLHRRGHDVVWWTAGFAHQTKHQRNRAWSDRTTPDGFTVRLVPTPAYRRNVGLGRLIFEAVFAWRVWRRGRHEARPDVIIAADPPQVVGRAGQALTRHHGANLIIDCLDLWPELFVRVSPRAIRPLVRLLVWPFFRLRRANLRTASRVFTVAESYRRRLLDDTKGLKPERVMSVPIGSPRMASTTAKRSGALRVIYAGTLGEKYDLMTVIEAAAILDSSAAPIEFLFAGRGPLASAIKTAIADRKLRNVTMLGEVDPTDLPRYYGSCDVGLVTYVPETTVALPVKLFDYIAAGLAVVSSIRGDLEDLASAAVVFFSPGDPTNLASALAGLAANRARCDELRRHSRQLAPLFDSDKLYERYAIEAERIFDEHS